MTRSASQPMSQRHENRLRIQATVEHYQGIKDHEALTTTKVQKGVQKIREGSAEYFAWRNKMQADVQPTFKLPPDAYAGKTTAESEIRDKVEKAQNVMRDKDGEYQSYLEQLAVKQKERLQEKLQVRRDELSKFESERMARDQAREDTKKDSEKTAGGQAKAYWKWLEETKNVVAARPGCAPPPPKNMKRAQEEELARKRADMSKKIGDQVAEYSKWVTSVSKPKFEMPDQKVNSPEDRDRIVKEKAKKGVEQLNVSTADYKKWLAEMDLKHRELMKERLQKKAEEEAALMAVRASAFAAIEKKMADAKADSDKRADVSRQEVEAMYERVRTRPLLIEQAYHFGRFMKTAT
eukprot:CAMPEP_0115085360 /NCGR_PEP_ID=MMETSP0227-20121206/21880_1 /TAXON_ID=89957 /ORGANISM="Polarella glacialis, Strain CCMP 1383" /LENGTH=350 /DNA_ID=CAMNT_0002474485 /DNA_START=170 /DNA_END=1222 /DNA_ORIENTATION=+